MKILYYLQINVIGLIILGIILRNQSRSIGISLEKQYFSKLGHSLIMILIFDSFMWIFDGSSVAYGTFLNITATSVYYILNCLVPYLWFLYTLVYFHLYHEIMQKYKWLIAMPFILNTGLILINISYPIVFQMDELNLYHRFAGYILTVMFAFLYLIASALITIKKLKESTVVIEKQKCHAMLFFPLLPAVAAILQSLFYGISIIWIFATLAFLIVFVNVQNQQISTDILTGLNNRYQFDRYLDHLFSNHELKQNSALMILDVNKFKLINDTYGHLNGDKALIIIAQVLKKACANTNSFLARYGGDEFAIICEAKQSHQIYQRIQSCLLQTNQSKVHPYELSLSCGYAFGSDVNGHIDELIAAADQAMYLEKQKRTTQSELKKAHP